MNYQNEEPKGSFFSIAFGSKYPRIKIDGLREIMYNKAIMSIKYCRLRGKYERQLQQRNKVYENIRY